ncbi:hypothetical protein FRX31_035015 [Thalictrum thalictroides]|uniref:Uncharacterized protein n=1 Tax=Thalictrum thalictroides TaxID=46969 RepID=A0A7J6USD1_THATH|nr:hypothetical protein FRX31_035015 [Thalictrum thalictroides]
MESFLSTRAEEIVSGGLMALVIPARPKENLSTKSFPFPLDILGSCLMDMAKKGVVNEAKVDSFNMPQYSPTVEEF